MTPEQQALLLTTARATQAVLRFLVDDRYPAADLWPRRAEDQNLLDQLDAAVAAFNAASLPPGYQ